MKIVPPGFSNANCIEFLLINNNFQLFLLTIWFSSDGIKVRGVFIIFIFSATLLQNVWNMFNLSCINYFWISFLACLVFRLFWIFQIVSNKQIIYLTYVIQAISSAWLFLPRECILLLHEIQTVCFILPVHLTIFSSIFYLFSPLGLAISQRRSLEPISLSPLF